MKWEKIEEFLDSRYKGADGDYPTWRHYIADLLVTLHREGEGFSGKRPLGNSGWDYDLAVGMKVMDPKVATLDPDGDLLEVDDGLAHKLFCAVVGHLCGIK